jgi:hypothetical protein
MLIWTVIAVALGAAVYVGLGGRVSWRAPERPGRMMGVLVSLKILESGPKGLDPNQPVLPAAHVERFEEGRYVLRFDEPFAWGGRTETTAEVIARHVGYPVSRAASWWRRGVLVSGRFGSGEAFIGLLRVPPAAASPQH